MKTTSFYVTSTVAGAGIVFALLIGDSLGLFEGHSRDKPPGSPEGENAGRISFQNPVEKTAKPSEKSRVGAVAPLADPAIQASRLKEENLKLRALNDELQNRLVAVLNWILSNFKGKYPLSETYLSKLQIAPLTEDYTLHSEALNFLKVTPDEERKMNDAFAYARRTLEEIETVILTVTNPRPDKVILHIPAFPEDGKVLRDDLYAALDATLGRDRFDRFLQVSETGLNQSFYQFGEASRTMVFELAYLSNSTTPQLKIKDGWVIELGSNSRQVAAVESYVTNLSPKYHSYLAWLPEYVGRYSSP